MKNQGKKLKKIAIAGALGSGKSTLSGLLQSSLKRHLALHYPLYSTGQLQREVAKKHRMTILELNEYARRHPTVDYEIDTFIKALRQQPAPFIIDSRLAWYFIPESFKVYLNIAPQTAALRILTDSKRKNERYSNSQASLEALRARRKSERERFQRLYAVDIAAFKNYDLVVKTDDQSPEEICALVLDQYLKACEIRKEEV